MLAPLLLVATLVSPAARPADDRLAVIAVSEPPGPTPALVELTNRLRAACRGRGLLQPGELRERLVERSAAAALAELDAAYATAMERYEAGEHPEAVLALRGILERLERLADAPAAHAQWLRALERLAQAELTVGHADEYRRLLERVASAAPRLEPDADEFSPTFRRDLEAARARVASRPRRRLTVTAIGGWAATVYVDGRAVGTAPVVLDLPSGRYRVGGVAGKLRVPSTEVQLGNEPRSVALDLTVAEALRPDSGPGLAVLDASRRASVVALGGWVGAARVVTASMAASADGTVLLSGALYDVRRGAVVREGRVTPAGVAALARFLLAGERSPEVEVPGLAVASSSAPRESTPPPSRRPTASPFVATLVSGPPAPPSSAADAVAAVLPPAPLPGTVTAADLRPLAREPLELGAAPRAPRGWMRPAAYGTALAALGAGALGVQQGLSARTASREAAALVRSDGTIIDATRYRDAVSSADAARRNAWVAGIGAAAFAATAGALGYLSFTDSGAPAVRF